MLHLFTFIKVLDFRLWLISLFVAFQESVVNILWNMLDNDTLETFTLAEQLSINLTDLNIRIEGIEQLSNAKACFVAVSGELNSETVCYV